MNSWYVITGAPSSGKTTLLTELQKRGFQIFPEVARVVIDEKMAQGLRIQQIRGNEAGFQQEVLRRKQALEAATPSDMIVLFDRGIHDSLAYMRLHGFAETEAAEAAKKAAYRKVFILDPLPVERDYSRTETDEQIQRIDGLLAQAYREHGYEPIRVPVAPVEARATLIEQIIAK